METYLPSKRKKMCTRNGKTNITMEGSSNTQLIHVKIDRNAKRTNNSLTQIKIVNKKFSNSQCI